MDSGASEGGRVLEGARVGMCRRGRSRGGEDDEIRDQDGMCM